MENLYLMGKVDNELRTMDGRWNEQTAHEQNKIKKEKNEKSNERWIGFGLCEMTVVCEQ